MGPVIIFILLALMWVLLAVPRQRAARRHRAVQASLAPGDEVMTSSGLYGRLVALDGETARVEIATGVVVKMVRQAVTARIDPADEPPLTLGTDDVAVSQPAVPAVEPAAASRESAEG